MTRIQRLWIFSDLHLETLDSDLGRALLRILSEPSSATDAVVFAGDIFELWVGPSPGFARQYEPFLAALRELLRKGVQIHYIEGNHDFHLARALPSGVIVEESRAVLNVQSSGGRVRKVCIEHGDLADPDDRAYRRLRSVLRSALLRELSEFLPESWIGFCAAKLSRPALRKESDLPERGDPGRHQRLRSIYRAHAALRRAEGADWVVMGHCHDLDEWEGFYWNMGYPPVHRQFLIFDPGASAGKDSLERRNFL